MDYLLDPELAAVASAVPTMDLADLASARESQRLAVAQLPKYESRTPITTTDVVVADRHDFAEVPVRIYASADRVTPAATLLYLHGGAYVMGDLTLADSTARMLVERAGVTVVAVDYRLAPEHPYPAGLADSYAALQWVADHGGDFGFDPDRLGVLGESAGGGLAAALTLLARDREGPGLRAQFLDAPTIDDRLNTPSMTTLVDTPVWQSVNSPHSWRYYLRGTAEPGGAGVPLYAAPARATVDDLGRLPPAFVTAYQVDPTRDEGLDYARMLIQAGVPTEVHHYAQAFHMAHIIPGTAIGVRIIADRIGAIRRMLNA
ncbi:alpha/beta hydrolase [Mycobacterium sp. Aquia_216]|uniref:alpha/beta hydrolase n=1 Tax=Mycobacterium sp. Aquia_216 TaxID=2991729 RepID=UPI00227AFDEA|nr:alpha/beta hydrolase [Mycobacterium sp. Aquia_216]WAJ46381.1 alpha/beta hydrolase [Mycobacterium sp. Aquia_216]